MKLAKPAQKIFNAKKGTSIMKINPILLAFLVSTSAFAEQKIEAEAQVLQDKGTQLSGTLRWLFPKSESTVFQWGTHLTGGVTENNQVTREGTLQSADTLFAGGGISFIGKTSYDALSAFSELTLGIDGLDLETSDAQEAKHLVFRVQTGLRLISGTGTFYSAGVSFINRHLQNDKQVRINDVLLTKYTLSPVVGFGLTF
ncbi:MAG: hypothetical protein RJB13_2566 [Pseudomonadota bacterium]